MQIHVVDSSFGFVEVRFVTFFDCGFLIGLETILKPLGVQAPTVGGPGLYHWGSGPDPEPGPDPQTRPGLGLSPGLGPEPGSGFGE